jgi:hypothetical protein
MMNNTNTNRNTSAEERYITAAQRREAARARRRERLQRSLRAREFAQLIEASR